MAACKPSPKRKRKAKADELDEEFTMKHQSDTHAAEDTRLVALARLLSKQLQTPEVRKLIRNARISTRLEDANFLERLDQLKHEIELALAL